ncbi:MAG: helix-turn-helix transcriptional regulator [Chloroflexi bacterium]|nr:helix-turn-helix transcriptional regulator [Chloroflexota bacterium]
MAGRIARSIPSALTAQLRRLMMFPSSRRRPMSMAGRMVRHARRRAGLTQRQLAAKAGIPQETIARIERGRVDPRVSTLDRLLEACGFGLEHLPRLGIGVDRPQIRERLAMPPGDRLMRAIREDRNMVDFRRRFRWVAERE